MFDTHCHLNFHSFNDIVDNTVSLAQKNGVNFIVIPGTDISSSEKAIQIASQYTSLYAAVGIHPHHVKEYRQDKVRITEDIKQIESLLQNKNVVAVGEIGMDRHLYQQTKYENTTIDENYIELQKIVLIEQIKRAIAYKKSLILHNREAKGDILPLLEKIWDDSLRGKSVFHCCEADLELLDFAKEHGMYIGVDGDITWSKRKQRFIKEVPLEMLVVETDSPFLTPEPIRNENPQNNPSNVRIVCEFVAKIKEIAFENVAEETENNGKQLFNLI
jgi:TatD DNase family protein